MKVEIINRLSGKLSLAVNIFHDITVTSEVSLKEFIKTQCAAILESHQKIMPPGFQSSRQLYRTFRIDPTKHRPSSEALWRRLKNKADFPDVNPFVNLTNLLSLKYQTCFGLYDMSKIRGPVETVLGVAGDTYQGIRKEPLNLNGKIVLQDTLGPFGNPSSDSLRTCTENTTNSILQVLFFPANDPLIQTVSENSKDMFQQFFSISHHEGLFVH